MHAEPSSAWYACKLNSGTRFRCVETRVNWTVILRHQPAHAGMRDVIKQECDEAVESEIGENSSGQRCRGYSQRRASCSCSQLDSLALSQGSTYLLPKWFSYVVQRRWPLCPCVGEAGHDDIHDRVRPEPDGLVLYRPFRQQHNDNERLFRRFFLLSPQGCAAFPPHSFVPRFEEPDATPPPRCT